MEAIPSLWSAAGSHPHRSFRSRELAWTLMWLSLLWVALSTLQLGPESFSDGSARPPFQQRNTQKQRFRV